MTSRVLFFIAITLPLLFWYPGAVGGTPLLSLLTIGCVTGQKSLSLDVRVLIAGIVGVTLIGAGGAELLRVASDLPLLLTLIIVVAVNDTAAYLGGKRFGGELLAPALSPKKTLSGSLCGIIGGLLMGLFLTGTNCTVYDGAVWLAVIIAAQIADLAKSLVKRHLGIKDFSTLLPGHGGILDRLDGILGGVLVLRVLM